MGKLLKKKLTPAQGAKTSTSLPILTSTPQYRSVLVICVGLVAITWLVFGPTFSHDFVNYDDPDYVYQNANITDGISFRSVVWAFTHVHAENWHPLTTLSHMIDSQLYGLKASGHHFTSVLLHTIAALLLFFLLRQMTGTLWPSAFVAAVFAIHPLRVESVAWVAERKDVLSGIFFMLTLISYVRYVRQPSIGRYVTMSILFACGLLSKPMLVTIPVVLLLLDFWPLQRIRNQGPETRGQKNLLELLVEKIPLFALSIGSSIGTLLAQQQSVGSSEQLPMTLRIGNAFVSCVIYMRQMIWPSGLAPFYPHPEKGLPFSTILAAAGLLIAITGAAFALRRRRPYLLTGWLWYAVMLLPVIGIIQVGWQARADRYTYLPQIGLYLALTWGTVDLFGSGRRRRLILTVAATGVVFALAWQAWSQASYWKNNEKLWTHTLAVTEDNDVAQNNLGTVLFQRGQVDEALARFELATRLRSGNAAAQDNLARALRRKGRISEAIVHGRKALELRPNKIDTRNMLGTMLFQQGDVETAIAEWRNVLSRQPDSYAQNNLAWVFATYPDTSVRDGTKAVELAKQALDLAGDNAAVLRTLAAAYAESGRFSEAIEAAQRAIKLAASQGDSQLANELEREITLYRDRLPLRASRPGAGDSMP